MKRAVLAAVLVGAVAVPAHGWAKGHKDDDDSDAKSKAKPKGDDDSGGSSSGDDDDDDSDSKPAKKPAKPDKSDKSDKPDKPDKPDNGSDDTGDDSSSGGDDDSGDDTPKRAKTAEPLIKQDLSGHDLGNKKGANEFERDRFFVDKVDTKKTEKTTLIQGSLTSTSFVYTESGGKIDPNTGVPSNSPFSRLFTDLRLQTDLRHISGGQWDGRIDVRGRIVDTPGNETTQLSAVDPGVSDKVQSGAYGGNELDIRELYLVRNGDRSDVIVGRQWVTDLASTKIDGVRVDYAKSNELTYLGFGGLYPVRGSRSIFTDYPQLLGDPSDADGTRSKENRFTGAAGGGAAYRTPNAYGSFGGVALVPLSGTDPRLFVTSSGYLRHGAQLDFYHFAVIDLASGRGLTNLSAGVNYKPNPRLRITASYNHVDTETLNVQANSFLSNPDLNSTAIQNAVYVQRISTNELRASISAGLGTLQRYQLTAAAAFRYRPDLTLSSPTPAGGTPTTLDLGAAQAVEVYASARDRRSVAGLQLGADISHVLGIGDVTYQRTQTTMVRAFGSRELKNGHGEWEAELDYLTTKDDSAGIDCNAADLATCFGAANATILSAGGTLYYRINRDWFAMGSLFLNHETVARPATPALPATTDPAILGITAFARIAYRF